MSTTSSGQGRSVDKKLVDGDEEVGKEKDDEGVVVEEVVDEDEDDGDEDEDVGEDKDEDEEADMGVEVVVRVCVAGGCPRREYAAACVFSIKSTEASVLRVCSLMSISTKKRLDRCASSAWCFSSITHNV